MQLGRWGRFYRVLLGCRQQTICDGDGFCSTRLMSRPAGCKEQVQWQIDPPEASKWQLKHIRVLVHQPAMSV